ncbi:MAG: RNA polymerase sigma factor [Prevotella sp.]|jgi:RNA polymerase sigma-70 factor (ECF subfamily)|nr:RNA polymerase sigma factor [Prevotella sp.]MCH3969592.1 RNA polymerase sigma factor [Prevotella sp.]MCH3985114.1 RNA polymerase sigma factor [Prevotella sp.]MCH3992830.1 RNA polymerase sigma factor [Prevotella sp.]MCH4018998.1 RNA polymerase sigma factor [Prevotella sp.]MCH4099409.1 RNA polymerase sigma factor [Prevotella sp.]
MKKISFRNDVLPLKNQLFRLALRITLNREEAEDIVQDTLIKVWNNRDRWEELDSIEAYCYTITRNLSLDRLKRQENQTASLDDDTVTEQADHSSDPSEKMIQEDRMERVREIVDTLPEKQRSCIQLRDFEGKSYKEIATIMDITEEQVKVNLFRGRQYIKKKYQELDKYGL